MAIFCAMPVAPSLIPLRRSSSSRRTIDQQPSSSRSSPVTSHQARLQSRSARTSSDLERVQSTTDHHRSASLSFTSNLARRSSRPAPQPSQITMLPIIQPQSAWDSYGSTSATRCFRINLHRPRQQVTSLLALSSAPRPVTPSTDEYEDTQGVILSATRAALEEEATAAAIADSLRTFAAEEGGSGMAVAAPPPAFEDLVSQPHRPRWGVEEESLQVSSNGPSHTHDTQNPAISTTITATTDTSTRLPHHFSLDSLRLSQSSEPEPECIAITNAIAKPRAPSLYRRAQTVPFPTLSSLVKPTADSSKPPRQTHREVLYEGEEDRTLCSSQTEQPSHRAAALGRPTSAIITPERTILPPRRCSLPSLNSLARPPDLTPITDHDENWPARSSHFSNSQSPPSSASSVLSANEGGLGSVAHRSTVFSTATSTGSTTITTLFGSSDSTSERQMALKQDRSTSTAVTRTNNGSNPGAPQKHQLSLPVTKSNNNSEQHQQRQATVPTRLIMRAEMFIIVRPPPGKQNHPLNLQIQLILPSLSTNAGPHHSRDPTAASSVRVASQSGSANPSRRGSISEQPLTNELTDEPAGESNENGELTRARSIRSVHSERSQRSNRTYASSTSDGRNRRVTPLYNLEWHTVLASWISDAGTDAKIAKFAKRGIDIVDLANIEPSEIRAPYAFDVQNFVVGGDTAKSPPGTTTTFSAGVTLQPCAKDDQRSPISLFNKMKRLSVFSSKKNSSARSKSSINRAFNASESNSEIAAHDTGGAFSDLPSTNGALSSVGPLAGSGQRADGYMWVVRKWNKPEILEWQAESPERNQLGPVLIEWRKNKKRGGRRHSKVRSEAADALSDSSHQPSTSEQISPTAISPQTPVGSEPLRVNLVEGDQPPINKLDNIVNSAVPPPAGLKGLFGRFGRTLEVPRAIESLDGSPSLTPTATTLRPPVVVTAPAPAQAPTDDTRPEEVPGQPELLEEESDADSDPEDSESPWNCEIVRRGAQHEISRTLVACLTPHPHHPKLVGQLAIPWSLSKIPLTDNDDLEGKVQLDVNEIKDLIAISCMWLVVKENLGGVGKRRKGDRAWRLGVKV